MTSFLVVEHLRAFVQRDARRRQQRRRIAQPVVAALIAGRLQIQDELAAIVRR